MNQAGFRRKVFYVLAIVVLLIPLYLLGQPASRSSAGGSDRSTSPGGTLSQLRDRYDIGQSNLGKLDPAGETMRLASLGLRGLAATILWQRADYYKEEKYWDKLSATLNQLSLLQPHFVSVWDRQAHNLSYNVSAEFDDYHQRYLWVKKGIEHLIRGTEFNRRQPLMQYTLGKYTTQKFGRSDEKKQFRELFRNDDAFHRRLNEAGIDMDQPEARGADRKPDNWLVGRLWFQKAYQLVEAGAPCKKSDMNLYQEAPLALMYHSEAIESEGVLDDRAIFAWSRAHDSWKAFGEREIQTTWNHSVKLGSYGPAKKAADEAQQAFDAFTADVQQTFIEKNKDKLTKDEFVSLRKPATERSVAESELAAMARVKTLPPPAAIVQEMPRDKRSRATALANEFQEKNQFADHVQRYRDLANYGYWEALSELEQTRTAVAARRQIYDAEDYLKKGDLEQAVTNFETGWKNWDKVLRKYPIILHDEICDRLLRSIDRYAKAATEGALPEDFPLNWFYRYRALRDKNKIGEETFRLYEGFVADAEKYDARLDSPFELPAKNEPTSSSTIGSTESKSLKAVQPSEPSAKNDKIAVPDSRPPALEPPL
jgi:hypothetical protein